VKSAARFIGAVEIGSAKATVLIGENTGTALNLIGFGECQSHGVIKGSVVDYKAASEAVHAAIEQAERSASERIDLVFLASTGAHLEGFYNEAFVNVKAADNMVAAQDIETVCRLATGKQLPPGRMVVRHLRRPFRLDGRNVPGSPENLVGQRLEAGYWTVHGQEAKLADSLHVIRGFNLEVRELILSSLASGHMVTTAEERQNGVLALDVGAGTTDFVLYRDGLPFLTGVLPVGGAHLTSDLALGLRLTEGQAEKIKLRHGRALVQSRSKNDKVWLDGNYTIGDRQFPQLTIEQITAARTWEIFEVVRKKLGTAFTPETCAGGVVITGGGAKLPGIAEAAARVFGLPAHLGEAPTWVHDNLRDPSYSTVLGLLYHGMAAHAESLAPARRGLGFLRKLFASA
jgi:cell division protein FtsA